MFSTLKLALMAAVITAAGFGYMYVTNLQKDLATAQENVVRLETAVATSEASLKLERENFQRVSELNNQLQTSLDRAETYGDELRATLQRHNLTHLATKKPGLIQPRMQRNTDELWKDLTAITTPDTDSGVQQSQP